MFQYPWCPQREMNLNESFMIHDTSWENSSKTASLFKAIDETMSKDRIDWDNVVSIHLDNTIANIKC